MKQMHILQLSHTLGTAFRRCATRFPVTVGFILALTVYLFLMTDHTDPFQERQFVVWGYYLSVGALLSLSLHLWSEEVKSRRTAIVTQLLLHALLVADAVFLYHQMTGTRFVDIAIAHAAGILALGLSVLFLPFFREKDDIPAWNFTQNAIGTLAIVALVAATMCGGLSLLAFSLHKLFDIDISHKCYLYILILCGELLPALLFLDLLPQDEAKHDRTPQPTAFLSGIIHYLFLPLAGCYLVVLYVYAGTIIARWELPDGWVSWLVVTLMTGCIAIEFALYPARVKYGHRKDRLIARLLPALALPLLLLMSIGIARRFMDYGITINRLYLATLNAWFYFVCIGLLATGARRISWIPISFSALFLLTSVLPVNYAGITRNALRADILKALENKTLPLSEEAYEAWMASLPAEDAERLNGKLAYLQDWYGKQSVDDIIGFYVPYNIPNEQGDVEVGVIERLHYEQPEGVAVNIPQGYTYSTLIRLKDVAASMTNGQIRLPFSDIKDTLAIRLEALRPLDADGSQPPLVLRTVKGEAPFMLTSFHIFIRGGGKADVTICGYRFDKDKIIIQKCN